MAKGIDVHYSNWSVDGKLYKNVNTKIYAPYGLDMVPYLSMSLKQIRKCKTNWERLYGKGSN